MTLPYPVRQWHPDPQEYALAIQRANQAQALASYGEYSMFVLMWKNEDFRAGLVGRCTECMEAGDKIAEAYGQADQERCATCFGTTYEGGFKARIVRPALWTLQDVENREEARRGVELVRTARVQSSSDFRLRTGDYIFRSSGERWRVQGIDSDSIKTGFHRGAKDRTRIGYNLGTVVREHEASVAYIIPPTNEQLEALDVWDIRVPQKYDDLEEIRGPLI